VRGLRRRRVSGDNRRGRSGVNKLSCEAALTLVALGVLVASSATSEPSGCPPPELPARPATAAPSLLERPEILRDVLYDRQEGVELRMDLLIPGRTDAAPVPVLFYPSAGGHAVPRNAFTDAALVHGFAVACAQVRYFEEASKFPDAIVDAKSAVRFLKAHASEYAIDPERIVACGSSKNGMFSSMLGTMGEVTSYDVGRNLHVTSRVAGVVNFAGHTDLTAFYTDGVSDPQVMMDEATYEMKNLQFLDCHAFACDPIERAASAITYVDPTDAPEMLVLGSEDPLVPVAQMTRFRDALLASCVPAYLLIVDGAAHGVAREIGQAEIDYLLAFLEMYTE